MPEGEFLQKIGMQQTPDTRISGAFEAAQGARPSTPMVSPTRAALEGAADAATFGFGDEIGAALDAGNNGIGNFGQRYQDALNKRRARLEIARDQRPVTTLAGEVAGAAALPVGAGARGGSLAARSIRSAITGAGAGAAYGYGSGQGAEDRLQGAGYGAAIGAGTGAVAPAVARGAARLVGNRPTTVGPSIDDLRQAAHTLYDVADQAGVVLKPTTLQKIATIVAVRAKAAGIDPDVHPKATGALRRLISDAASGQGVTLRQMDTLRQIVRDAGSGADAGERRIASILTEGLDEQLNRLRPSDVSAGDLRTGLTALRGARQTWSRMRKGEDVETMFERARNAAGANYTQAGFETALRQQFRALANSAARMRAYTPEEQAAIKKVVRGAPVTNVLRLIGKAAPRGAVSSMPAVFATAVFGPVVGAGVVGGGEIAKRAATARTISAAERVGEMARSGRARFPAAPATQLERGAQKVITNAGAEQGQKLLPEGDPLRVVLTASERDRVLKSQR
jgi:hypothetical protein